MTTFNEAIEFYNNINNLRINDAKSFKSYLMRLHFENSPDNQGNKRETENLKKCYSLLFQQYILTQDFELRRKLTLLAVIIDGLSLCDSWNVGGSNRPTE